MSNNVKKDIKTLKKKIKSFKKVSSSNHSEGIILAKEIVADIKKLEKLEDVKNNPKTQKEVAQIYDGMQMYIDNAKRILNYKKKWE